jgi:hypothetical protein
MSLPGFTAEASIYRTSELYQMRSMDAIRCSEVVPQQMERDIFGVMARDDVCTRSCRCCIITNNPLCCWVCLSCSG